MTDERDVVPDAAALDARALDDRALDARVWAPRAEQLALHRERPGVGGNPAHAERVAMTRTDGDWWVAEGALEPGDRYGFLIDGDEHPRPDPRSRRQPDGVHGLSALDDPAAFAWLDEGWHGRQLAGSVIYELHIGTYSPEGTFDGAISRLDHLLELGIDMVEVLPVNGFNGTHNWGYDGVLWFTVHEQYGGPDGYRRFVDACHTRGLAVVQDVVYNHLGPSGNYLPLYGPYLREGAANTWGDSVNVADPEVRRYVLDNVAMWFDDFHVDGLRLDAVHALIDDSPVHILQVMAEESDARSAHLRRPLTLIAESDLNDPRLILPREAGGYGLTAQWSDDHHHAMHAAVTGESSGYYADFAARDALQTTTTGGFLHAGTYSSFRGREHGHPVPADLPTWRLVTFAQDHDQIGNRAAGDRLSQSLTANRLAVAAVLNLTSPFTPMLFMGEEWGAKTPWQFFTSHPEPELGRATAEGRLAEFVAMGWDESVVPDPQARSTFENSRLDWSELEGDEHARLFGLHRALIRLRRESPELTDARFAHTAATTTGPSPDARPTAFEMRRGAGLVDHSAGLMAVCVAFDEPAEFDWKRGSGEKLMLATSSKVRLAANDAAGMSRLMLPAWSAAVVRLR